MIYEFYVCSDVDETEEAVSKFALDTEKETLTKVAGFSGVSHPSYMAFNKDKSMLYTVQDGESDGILTAIRVESGEPEIGTTDLAPEDVEDLTESVPDRLSIAGTYSTRGAGPCHVSVSENDRWLYVSNYDSGSLAVFPLNEGVPEDRPQLIKDEGRGKDPEFQDGPHMHAVYEKDENVYLVDTGLDTVDVYEPSEDDPELLEDSGLELKMPAGSGPSKLIFNDEHTYPEVYVLCELSGQVLIWIREHGTWRLADKWPTVPNGYFGKNTPTAMKGNSYMTFVANKGDNSVAVYRIINYGFLERTQVIKSGGGTPRDLEILDRYLVVANEDADLLTVFRISLKEQKIEATNIKAEVPKPRCVVGYRVAQTPVTPEDLGEEEEDEEGEEGEGTEEAIEADDVKEIPENTGDSSDEK